MRLTKAMISAMKTQFTRCWRTLANRPLLSRASIAIVVLATMTACFHSTVTLGTGTRQPTSRSVPGQSYLICDKTAQYLTSPWTYHALASGSQSYTVARYKALAGYGTTLPPLPSYIANESSGTEAAIIYAPGSAVGGPAYDFPGTPILYFFEGGAYTGLGLQSASGDEFIGGSAPGYPEPRFNDRGQAGGIQQTNDSYSYYGGSDTLAASAKQGAKSVGITSAPPKYYQFLTFSDGFTDKIDHVDTSTSPISVVLDAPLPSAQSAGGTVWITTHSPIAVVRSAAAQGTGKLTLTANARTSTSPILPFGAYVIGVDNYQVQSVAGSEATGYTVGVASGGLDTAVAAGTPVYYNAPAGDVTVSYLDISHDVHNGDSGIITTGAGWTITHNNLHDSYGGNNSGDGDGIVGGDESTIEYNCLSRLGNNAMAGQGTNAKWAYNEVYQSAYTNDPGCGCTSAGKWWATLNTDIVNNAFIDGGYGGSGVIWLDNGNSGTNISGNYFDKAYGSAIGSETGFNLNITNNLFEDGGWGSGNGCGDTNCVGAVDLNSSGGFHVPGSRYDDQVNVSGNQFIDNWGGVDIWESGLRNCESSGEGWPDDHPYCSGGYPATHEAAAGGQYYFSHTTDSTRGGTTTVVQPAAAGSTTILLQGEQNQSAEAINDQIGFTDPASTTASATGPADVTKCTPTHPCTIPVASTSGFPAANGELRAGTTAAGHDGGGGFTGAIFKYASAGGNKFAGVTLVRGSGAVQRGYAIQEVQPYQVTADTCYANDCRITISPALTRSIALGTSVANTGTCSLFATATATPTNPIAPDGTSYFDGCQWRVAHISITSNNFIFDPAAIASGTTVTGKAGTSCTAAHANACGTNFMAFQDVGQAPWGNAISQNAMMSDSRFTGCPEWDPRCGSSPLANINGLASPPNAPAGNGEAPWDDLWSKNRYQGPWMWNAYNYGPCDTPPSDSRTDKTLPPGACGVNFAKWRGYWQQDTNSAYSATVSPAPAS